MSKNEGDRYRSYSDDDIDRIWAIKVLQGMGYTLNEIVDVVGAAGSETFDFQDSISQKVISLEAKKAEELKRLSNLFGYSQTKQCFTEDKLCDVRMLTLGRTKVQLCMLNSAPFSTRKREDKQLHYFPTYVAEKLERSHEATLKITVMHHHYEWCEWNTKEMLKNPDMEDPEQPAGNIKRQRVGQKLDAVVPAPDAPTLNM